MVVLSGGNAIDAFLQMLVKYGDHFGHERLQAAKWLGWETGAATGVFSNKQHTGPWSIDTTALKWLHLGLLPWSCWPDCISHRL